MNNIDHHKVVELAVPALPERSRAFWAPRLREITATCMYPDHYAIPLLDGEGGPWRHYFPKDACKHSFEKIGASARSHFFDVRFYVESIFGLIGKGDIAEACRFLGVLSHCIGDFAEPAHYYEHEITLLLPPPPDMINCNSHRILEDVPSKVSSIGYVPGVLGDSAETVIMRLEGRLREVYERTLGVIIPMLSACYRRDIESAGTCVDSVVASAAEVMADLLHTFWCVQARSWTGKELEDLAVCRLDRLEPASYDVEFNYGCRPMRDAITIDQVGHAMPLQLRFRRDGADVIEPVEGICVIPHALPLKGTEYLAAIDFDLPPGVFRSFSCAAGMLAGFEPQAVCRFCVYGDGKKLHESKEMREKDDALKMEVYISGVRRLRLAVFTDRSTDKLAMPVWAWPKVKR